MFEYTCDDHLSWLSFGARFDGGSVCFVLLSRFTKQVCKTNLIYDTQISIWWILCFLFIAMTCSNNRVFLSVLLLTMSLIILNYCQYDRLAILLVSWRLDEAIRQIQPEMSSIWVDWVELNKSKDCLYPSQLIVRFLLLNTLALLVTRLYCMQFYWNMFILRIQSEHFKYGN